MCEQLELAIGSFWIGLRAPGLRVKVPSRQNIIAVFWLSWKISSGTADVVAPTDGELWQSNWRFTGIITGALVAALYG